MSSINSHANLNERIALPSNLLYGISTCSFASWQELLFSSQDDAQTLWFLIVVISWSSDHQTMIFAWISLRIVSIHPQITKIRHLQHHSGFSCLRCFEEAVLVFNEDRACVLQTCSIWTFRSVWASSPLCFASTAAAGSTRSAGAQIPASRFFRMCI